MLRVNSLEPRIRGRIARASSSFPLSARMLERTYYCAPGGSSAAEAFCTSSRLACTSDEC